MQERIHSLRRVIGNQQRKAEERNKEIRELKADNIRMRTLIEDMRDYYIERSLSICDICMWRKDCVNRPNAPCQVEDSDAEITNDFKGRMSELGIGESLKKEMASQ